MNVMVTVSLPMVVEVSIFPCAFLMFTVSDVVGFVLLLFGPHATADVNATGVNFGSEEVGSPWSGASMIHATVLPLKFAPGGGAIVIEKWEPVVTFANVIVAAVVPTYCTAHDTASPGAAGIPGIGVS